MRHVVPRFDLMTSRTERTDGATKITYELPIEYARHSGPRWPADTRVYVNDQLIGSPELRGLDAMSLRQKEMSVEVELFVCDHCGTTIQSGERMVLVAHMRVDLNGSQYLATPTRSDKHFHRSCVESGMMDWSALLP